MKKIFLPLVFAIILPSVFSCRALRGYSLNEADAVAALRQLLEIGAKDGVRGAFSKETFMQTLFPEPVRKTLNTLQQLGLSNEVDRFTTTLSTAAETTAERSIPIFVHGIRAIRFTDAVRIVKSGGTAATDYLRSSIGDSLRHSITPVMQSALNEYKLIQQWNDLIKPVKTIAGDKLNLDLANLMAGVVSEAMFRKIAEKEKQIRTDASARTTRLLQKVFSRSWD
ncbi:MAG: DUF4197 domain-containing protein [Chitinophagaceae bacterium]|nr:DUF4197 domain-containing protein [Chitinophagaceae bacterium]